MDVEELMNLEARISTLEDTLPVINEALTTVRDRLAELARTFGVD
jgi:uncharacterized coiled-coil protein SlyX